MDDKFHSYPTLGSIVFLIFFIVFAIIIDSDTFREYFIDNLQFYLFFRPPDFTPSFYTLLFMIMATPFLFRFPLIWVVPLYIILGAITIGFMPTLLFLIIYFLLAAYSDIRII